MSENYQTIANLAQRDVQTLKDKGKTYGSSWKKRGGVGAFMMLARKWDRIENIVTSAGYDIFKAGRANTGDVLDDIADLRAYLLLVESEVINSRDVTSGFQGTPVFPGVINAFQDAVQSYGNPQPFVSQAQQAARMGNLYAAKEDGSEPTSAYVNQG